MVRDVEKQVGMHAVRVMVIVLALVIWELASYYDVIDPFFFSRPSDILLDLKELVVTGYVFQHVLITLKEMLLGLTMGTLVGILAAFILGRFESLAEVFNPIITALYGVPKLALAPLFILWFGLGMGSKVFLSLLMTFFLIFFNTCGGIRNVDPVLIDAVRLMGANDRQIMRKVIFPSCVPWILTGLRASLGASLLGAIVGEYIGASAGLGWLIDYATGMFDTTRVLSCIVILMSIVTALNRAVKALEKRLLRWRPTTE